jgi:AraC-like DNA-binding protein
MRPREDDAMPNADAGFFRYPPVSPMDEAWGVFVPTAGYQRIGPGSPYPPARHPEGYQFAWERGRVLQQFVLVYITRGEGVFESATAGRRRIRAGNLFLLFPGEWHRYAPDRRTGWDEYWVSLDGAWPRQLLEKGFFTPRAAVLDPGDDEVLLELFIRLVDLLRDDPVGFHQLAGAAAVQILSRLHAASLLRSAGGDAADPLVRRAKCLLVENSERAISVRQVARELNVSYSRFRALFRRCTGLSPAQYHLQLRIRRACQMLEVGALRIKEVADRLGFESPYYFSRLFKKKTGVSPEAWRTRSRRGRPSRARRRRG